MATIIAQRKDCTGKGLEVWVKDDGTPIYFAPHLVTFDVNDKPTYDAHILDTVIAQRAAAKAEAEKMAAVDTALSAEFERRKGEAADLYDKTPEDAVDSVFATAVAVAR